MRGRRSGALLIALRMTSRSTRVMLISSIRPKSELDLSTSACASWSASLLLAGKTKSEGRVDGL